MNKLSAIPDVQNSADTRNIAIDRVGVKNIKYPIRVRERSGSEQHTAACFSMSVELPHQFKGTHMSRFVEVLNMHDHVFTIKSFKHMLAEMIQRLDAKAGYIKMTFPYFITKSAPVSGIQSLMDYEATFIGEINGDRTPVILTQVIVPVTTVCPCSKEISDCGAHNQRSQVAITVRTNSLIWIEELIDIVENEASCELYSILKRSDEKYVTEHAYNNPKFAEDIVRDIAIRLNSDTRIVAYTVETENFESIHNHSAFACIQCEKEGTS
jgi:GTP cyclohydrolase I